MSANQKLIQIKSLVKKLIKERKGDPDIPENDIQILTNFLEGKATIAETIKVVRKMNNPSVLAF